jgi:two-component system sensor histidine kinase KdpD
MNGGDRVTHLRADDLLDETPPKRRTPTLGLSRRRQLTGLGLAAFLLPLLTLLLRELDSVLALDGQVLVYLLAVVVIAVVGGVIVGVASGAVAALLINYFFVEPVHTLTVTDPDQTVALVVFVVVAATVSIAVEIAGRRVRAAEQARAEAETLSTLAGADLEEEKTLHGVLSSAREAFGMESVALKVRSRGSGEWSEAEHAGWAPVGAEAPLRFDVPIGSDLRLVGRGPALFAEDQRVLHAFAAAAQTAYEGRELSGRAMEAETLATVDQQRTALLAAVGHDLRTPLAGIKASVSSLRQTDVEWAAEERDELLATIEESADQLDAVVRNLLDASRLQAGALSVQLDAVAVDEVVSAALIGQPEGSAEVGMDVAEDLPAVRADRGLLERVLANVIDNAARHGAGDEPIAIRAFAGADSVKIEVIDHGPGVSSEERAGLFEPFRKLDDRDSGGIGLGLAVARGFMEAMGGAMVADQTPGGGLTMRLRLPIAPRQRSGGSAL